MIDVLGIFRVLISWFLTFTLLFIDGFWDVYARFNGKYMGAFLLVASYSIIEYNSVAMMNEK